MLRHNGVSVVALGLVGLDFPICAPEIPISSHFPEPTATNLTARGQNFGVPHHFVPIVPPQPLAPSREVLRPSNAGKSQTQIQRDLPRIQHTFSKVPEYML
jgi:hypothetical protein